MLPNLNGSVSVKVVLIFRETGSEYSCKWCYTSGIYKKQESGLSLQKAKKEATEELRGKAALHNPDQIAGGTPIILSAKGDASVNSALGSLWNHGRAEKLYKRVAKMAENMTEKEKNMTYLNVRFNIYSK